jgi:5-formyltetrahydrofolate cyclo-ligase
LEETRKGLRRALLERRSQFPTATCMAWSRSIQAKVLELPEYLAASSVALYCAIRNEVETRAIMNDALGRGKKVFCPKIDSGHPALFVQISSEADLVSGLLGAPEPRDGVPLNRQERDDALVVVPGVAFDPYGNRLGRGGGWYDRALDWFDGRGVFVGLAYELQVVDSVPMESWDKKVHYVITESRVIDCGNAPHRQVTR